MALSIDELLAALKNPADIDPEQRACEAITWERIGSKDAFSELGLEQAEVDARIKEWIANNPYKNI